MISTRSEANLPRQDLIYLDANNLYGWAMLQSLPTHGFRFLQQGKISVLRLQDLSDDDEDGYILSVDLNYPASLHNQHDDYPLAPKSLVIDHSMYLPTQHSVFPESAPEKKLTPNLHDKVKYVVHYRNLKLYLQLGLVITKVHRVLTFKQSLWLKTCIDFNTWHRSVTGNSFLKDFFKLMNNRVLGNRVNVELVTDTHLLRKRVAEPTFFVLQTISLCKVATLELSKLHMYDFHYNHMKVKYPHAYLLRLLFTDTDSLAYAVQTDDIYKDMLTDAADRYDFSPLITLFMMSNHKALEFFKDQLNSVPMQDFVMLFFASAKWINTCFNI